MAIGGIGTTGYTVGYETRRTQKTVSDKNFAGQMSNTASVQNSNQPSVWNENGKSRIRIDDAELQGLNIAEQTVVEEVIRNGKKHYSYTSKADFDCGIRNSTGSTEVEDGSVLQSVNRPRRTVIKL